MEPSVTTYVYTGAAIFTNMSSLAAYSNDQSVTITASEYGVSFRLASAVNAGQAVTVPLNGSRVVTGIDTQFAPINGNQFNAEVTINAPNFPPTGFFRTAAAILTTTAPTTDVANSGTKTIPTQASSTGVSGVTQSSGASASTGTSAGSSASAAPAQGGGGGLGTGGIVGIVVAIVAVIALIAAFFLIRRRKQRKARTNQYSSKTAAYNNKPTEGEAYVLATGTKAGWQKNLPQPESDQTITQLANRTLDAIELFVENYYSDQPNRQLQASASPDMALFNSPHLSHPLGSVIPSSRSPTVLIKHCLAYYLLQKIDPTRNNPQSLLPSEYVIPAKGDQQALAQLRTRIAQKSNIDQDEHYLTRRTQVSEATIQQVEHAFQPWARGDPQDRVKSLRGILTHLSEMGNKFFSQAADFEWRWDSNRKLLPHQLVMLPGLDKMTDSEAVPLARPIRLVEPRLGKYGE